MKAMSARHFKKSQKGDIDKMNNLQIYWSDFQSWLAASLGWNFVYFSWALIVLASLVIPYLFYSRIKRKTEKRNSKIDETIRLITRRK